MKRFKGIYTVMVTAYDGSGGIDSAAMGSMTRRLIDAGVHGLVVLGSNGECPYLTCRQKHAAVEAVVAECSGSVPVIVGINERGTEPAISMARHAEENGADGLLVALPLFYPLDEDAVRGHYEAVCAAVGLPVLFYNFPTTTHLSLAPDAIARIAKIDGIVGAKETIFDVSEVKALVKATDDDFCAFTGMTLNLMDTMAVGACGAICPLPNVVPEKAVALYEALVAGEGDRAAALQAEFYALAPLLASSPTPHAMMKEALRLLGVELSVTVKSPLPALTDAQAETVKATLTSAGLL